MGKKRITIVASALAVVLCGCVVDQESIPGETAKQGIPTSSKAADPVRITLSLPTAPDAPLTQIMSELAADYGKETGITVTVHGSGEQGQAVLTELLGSRAADLYLIPSADVEGYARQSLIANLSGTAADHLVAVLHDAAVDWCRWDNSLWGIPYLGYTAALGYNTQLLEEAGVADPPATWEAMESVCLAVEAQTEAAGIAGVAGRSADMVEIMLGLIGSAGGSIATEQDGAVKMTADTPPVRNAIAFYAQLLRQYGTEESDQNGLDRAVQEAQLGRAALFWALPAHLAVLEKAKFPVGSGALPEGKSSGCGVLHAYSFVLPQQAAPEARRAAEGFLQYLYTPAACNRVLQAQYNAFDATMETINRDALLMPLLRDLDSIAFYREHPLYRPFAEAMAETLPPASSKKWGQIRDNVLQPLLRDILLGEVELEEGLQAIDENASLILLN